MNTNTDATAVGNRLKELRKVLNIKQSEFAERIGIGATAISNYEAGRNIPQNIVISNICTKFNVSEDWLRTGEGQMFRLPPEEDDAYRRHLDELQISSDPLIKSIIEGYFMLNEQQKTLLWEIIEGICNRHIQESLREAEEVKQVDTTTQ